LNYNQAVHLMNRGVAVQSLVSKTTYKLSNDVLLAEGLPVANEYITEEEKNGEWREVTIINTRQEYKTLSNKEIEDILSDAYIQFKFNEKHGR
jgi:hypothetical protein